MAVDRLTNTGQPNLRQRMRACVACSGAGVLDPAMPSCDLPPFGPGWILVERCDACERFSDDLAAARSRYTVAGWFQCRRGGWHAVAASNSKRPLQRKVATATSGGPAPARERGPNLSARL
jgi:hypothetical protein